MQTCLTILLYIAILLVHHTTHAELALFTDALDEAIGVVLQQKKNDMSQKKYSHYDRELLAIYEGIRHFKYMIEAQIFAVYTDHR